MKKLRLYKGDKTYMTPDGNLANRDAVLAMFPAALDFKHVIETDQQEEVLFSMMNLSALRSQYEIDPSLSSDDAIELLEQLINAPPPDPDNSPEERIAAALEFQNLLSL